MEQEQLLILSPASIPQISKVNASIFHSIVKDKIKETGDGIFEYLELIKFVEKLKEVISGNSQSKNPLEKEGDKEFRDMVREAISRYEGAKFTTPRGATFQNCETGHKFDFSKTEDFLLPQLEQKLEEAKAAVDQRKEYLKALPPLGMEQLNNATGEMVTIYPPAKSSTSSYKITLPK